MMNSKQQADYLNYLLTQSCHIAQLYGPLIVILPHNYPADSILSILNLPNITGVIVSQKIAEHHARNPCIGYFNNNRTWQLPECRAKSLLDLNHYETIGLFRLLSAKLSGLQQLIHIDKNRAPQTQAISTLLIGTLLTRLFNKLTGNLYTELTLAHRLTRLNLASHAESIPPFEQSKQRVTLYNCKLGLGGAERQLINTANGLQSQNIDVAITLDPNQDAQSMFFANSINSGIPITHRRHLTEIASQSSKETLETIETYLQQRQLYAVIAHLPDCLRETCLSYAYEMMLHPPTVAHFWQDKTNALGGLVAHCLGIPKIILGTRNMRPNRFSRYQAYIKPIYQFLLQQPSVVMINNSYAGARDYADWLKLPLSQIQVIHNGTLPLATPDSATLIAWQQAIKLDATRPVIGCLCRFTLYKSPLLWLDTAAHILRQQPDSQFLLVGDGPMKLQIQQRAKALGISDNLIMPGPQTDCRLPMASMDVLLLTSKLEGLPNVLIEAQMLGIPVVATPAGGSAETMRPGESGFIVEPNARQLAEKTLNILKDQNWRQQASIAGQTFVQKHFNVERMLADTQRVYGWIDG